MDIAEALAFYEEAKQPGTLVTLFGDGRPQVSIVVPAVIDGHLWVSATQSRAKTRNIRGDARVTFVSGTGPWVAVEGTARIIDGDDVLEKLRRYYHTLRDEHPDWADYDRAMREEQRVIIDMTPSRAYGMGL